MWSPALILAILTAPGGEDRRAAEREHGLNAATRRRLLLCLAGCCLGVWITPRPALAASEVKQVVVLPVVVTKLAKNLKWAARKNHTERIILHSFAHLAEHRAPPETAAEIIAQVEQRLLDTGYSAAQTPFGYLLDLQLSAPGREFTRIYKEF